MCRGEYTQIYRYIHCIWFYYCIYIYLYICVISGNFLIFKKVRTRWVLRNKIIYGGFFVNNIALLREVDAQPPLSFILAFPNSRWVLPLTIPRFEEAFTSAGFQVRSLDFHTEIPLFCRFSTLNLGPIRSFSLFF